MFGKDVSMIPDSEAVAKHEQTLEMIFSVYCPDVSIVLREDIAACPAAVAAILERFRSASELSAKMLEQLCG